MKTDDFETFAEYYDKLYHKRGKDYEKEVKIIEGVIKQTASKSRSLLDVGCGTGNHLKYFSRNFSCTGVDVSRRMIEIARKKVPEAKFEVGNMVDFSLKERFDVITCLFSAIGYVETFNNLIKTSANFYRHLNNKGVAIIEPWVFTKDFKTGNVSLDTLEEQETKFVRMATSKIAESKWTIFMHYLIGKQGKIKHVRELHKMAALNPEDYLKAFEVARFRKTRYITDELWNDCRGLFIARK